MPSMKSSKGSHSQMAVCGVTLDMKGVSFDLNLRKPFVMPGAKEQVGADLDQALGNGCLTALARPT